MRLSFTSTACQGKTTLVNDFIKQWPSYKKSKESYRDLIKEGKIKNLNKQVNEESQWAILNALVKDQNETRKGDNVVFDRCALDNLAYSLWGYEHGLISKEFIDKCIPLVKESMRKLDIIFFIPITNVVIQKKESRETDPAYIKEVDCIFKAIHYQQQKGQCAFFPKDDMPPIIEVFGSPEQRVEIIKIYLDQVGELRDTPNFLTMEGVDMMTDLLNTQKEVLAVEKKLKF